MLCIRVQHLKQISNSFKERYKIARCYNTTFTYTPVNGLALVSKDSPCLF